MRNRENKTIKIIRDYPIASRIITASSFEFAACAIYYASLTDPHVSAQERKAVARLFYLGTFSIFFYLAYEFLPTYNNGLPTPQKPLIEEK